MAKLSEDLQDLADHVANVEKEVTAAQARTKEKIESRVAAAKENARAHREDARARFKQRQQAAASFWTQLETDYTRSVERIRADLAAKKDARETHRAERRAEDAEEIAAAAIAFAAMAIDDAEIATLEAIDARAVADMRTSGKGLTQG